MARPPEITSSVVVAFANRAGLRYGTAPTSRLRLTRSVRAARAERIVLPSSIQFSGGPTPRIWCRWSITSTVSIPDDSAVVAISESRSISPLSLTPGKLKLGICRPRRIGARSIYRAYAARFGSFPAVQLAGARVLVTGATGGIGGALARALHARGATVVVSGRREELLDELRA